MQRTRHLHLGALVLGAPALCPAPAHAWEFRCRFVQRVGTMDTPLVGDTINASDLLPHRVRFQFGVFDTPDSPAPAGGFVGWNVGTISVSGPADNSDERRTPGRLSPFNFAAQAGSNGDPPLPGGDPFTTLEAIDATLGTQSPIWLCGPDGLPTPMPQAVVRGRNTFVSTFEVTVDPRASATSYTLSITGNLIACLEWRTVGTPTPPECPPEPCPSECYGGLITYAPVTAPPQPFACTLQVFVPSPAAAPLMLTLLALAHPRRRGISFHVPFPPPSSHGGLFGTLL